MKDLKTFCFVHAVINYKKQDLIIYIINVKAAIVSALILLNILDVKHVILICALIASTNL